MNEPRTVNFSTRENFNMQQVEYTRPPELGNNVTWKFYSECV